MDASGNANYHRLSHHGFHIGTSERLIFFNTRPHVLCEVMAGTCFHAGHADVKPLVSNCTKIWTTSNDQSNPAHIDVGGYFLEALKDAACHNCLGRKIWGYFFDRVSTEVYSLVVSSFKQNKATSTNTMQHLSPKTVKLLNAIVSPTSLICLVRLHYHSPNDTIRSSMLFNQKCCEPWWVGENWRWKMVKHDEAHEHTCRFRMQ